MAYEMTILLQCMLQCMVQCLLQYVLQCVLQCLLQWCMVYEMTLVLNFESFKSREPAIVWKHNFSKVIYVYICIYILYIYMAYG